jgi:hypothetical protein
MVRNVVRLEELLTDIYHQREQVEDEDIEHISPAFAMNLVMLDRHGRRRGRKIS